MKAIFQAMDLQKVLKDVVRIIPSTAKTNVQKFVRITADKAESQVEFVTSSADVSIRRTMFELTSQSPLAILESGVCLLPARELLEIAKRATDKLELTLAKGKVTLKFGTAKFVLNGLDPREFSPYQNTEETSRIEMDALALRGLLAQTTYACAVSETRPVLTGVHFTIADNAIHAMATDGLRLAMAVAAGSAEWEQSHSLTIPKAPLESMLAMLPKDDDEVVELEIGSTVMVATWGDGETSLVMRGFSEAYPDTSRIVPASTQSQIRVARGSMLEALERLEMLCVSNNRQIHVDFRNTYMDLSVSSAEGSGQDTVEIAANTQEIQPMFFNVRFLLDVLKAVDAEEIEFGINGQNAPVLVNPVGGTGQALISPIMYTATAVPRETAVEKTA